MRGLRDLPEPRPPPPSDATPLGEEHRRPISGPVDSTTEIRVVHLRRAASRASLAGAARPAGTVPVGRGGAAPGLAGVGPSLPGTGAGVGEPNGAAGYSPDRSAIGDASPSAVAVLEAAVLDELGPQPTRLTTRAPPGWLTHVAPSQAPSGAGPHHFETAIAVSSSRATTCANRQPQAADGPVMRRPQLRQATQRGPDHSR